MSENPDSYTVFIGHRRLATGSAPSAAHAAADALESGKSHVLVFEDRTGRQIDVDLRGPTLAIPVAEPASQPRGRGRPKLGVVAREVTLLPRHWDWLAAQPGGASATLRRLIDDARLHTAETDRARKGREAAYRIMSALAGDLPGFEEASRALFASELERFHSATAHWPDDVRAYLAQHIPTSLDAPQDGSPRA